MQTKHVLAVNSSSPVENIFLQIAPSYCSKAIRQHFAEVFKDVAPATLEIQIIEFLKFMFLRSTYETGFIPLSGDVDDIWHEFILQTREYELFCLALPGKRFIHHNSKHLSEYSKNENKRDVVSKIVGWLPAYYHNFGEFTEEASIYWMIVGYLQTEFKMSLVDINQLAKTNPISFQLKANVQFSEIN